MRLAFIICLVAAAQLAATQSALAQDAPPPPPPPPPPEVAAGDQATAPPHTAPGQARPDGCKTRRRPLRAPPRCARPLPAKPPVAPATRHRRLRRTRIYIGLGTGVLGVFWPKVYGNLSPGAVANLYLGLRFRGRVAVELGVVGSHVEERQFDEDVGLWGVTLDMRWHMVPTWRIVSPYLIAGFGVYGLVTANNLYYTTDHQFGERRRVGGGVQFGLGIDIRLLRWLALGARVLYRGLILPPPDCFSSVGGQGVDPCATYSRHGLLSTMSGELTLTIVL